MKWPCTPHLPFSRGRTADDIEVLQTNVLGRPCVITEKVDGECTGMTKDLCHARSVDSKDHPSRHVVKALWGRVRQDIPSDIYIFGENAYAEHSIHYDELPDYFMVFSVVYKEKEVLAWDDVREYAHLLGLPTVPVILEDVTIRSMDELEGFVGLPSFLGTTQAEGFVIRTAGKFDVVDFGLNVAKYVRPNHVTTSDHWMFQAVKANRTKG